MRTIAAMLLIPCLASVPVSAGMSAKAEVKAQKGGAALVDVIVTYEIPPGLAESDRIGDLGGQVFRSYDRLPMKAVRVPAHALPHLANGKGVRHVAIDAPVLGNSTESARATAKEPAPGTSNSGYRGYGVRVAVIDSGLGLHTDLPSSTRQYSFLNGAFPRPEIDDGEIESYRSDPLLDPHGHGTHVAGLIAGDGAASSGSHRGLADDAQLLSLRVLDDNGRGVTSDVIAALDWLLQYGSYFDVEVVNISLGKAVEESASLDPLVLAAEAVWDKGMVVVCSAGNYGRDGHFTVTSPGNSRKVITVGSLTDKETADPADDFPSTYSSRGPTMIDHVLKPDLLAPGNRLVSTTPAGAKLNADMPDRVLKCSAGSCSVDYLELSGTSMAAAMVSGAVAMMLDKDKYLDPPTIKARLMRSARKVQGDPTIVGAGVLDVEAALDATGSASSALSPLMARSDDGTVVYIQQTGILWGDAAWDSAFIFTDGYAWSDAYTWSDGYVFTDAYAWSDAYVWTDAYAWSDGYPWNDAYAWTDSYAWSDAVQNVDPLFAVGAEAMQLSDDE